jgi:hypothetical protein
MAEIRVLIGVEGHGNIQDSALAAIQTLVNDLKAACEAAGIPIKADVCVT